MSQRLVDSIHGRMSLRAPQRDSLEILRKVADAIPLRKDQDLVAALAAARSISPTVTDFERDFPSLCFALATGVGKTRLMGAFITYLHLAKGHRHFFVLAPNLTIYDKLIREFTPGDPKYVFNGIAEFAQTPPEVITGDNYESGRGVREDRQVQYQLGVSGAGAGAGAGPIHVNIFNISKINTEVRGGAMPRIKRLAEYIGESYFDYLAGLPDLVLLMDESHRYRASAGVRAINELKPVIGLELTATPFVEAGAQRQVFNNVAYEYPLARAIRDGFVKEPAVATRENFQPGDYSAEQLDDVKLRDGVRLHEATKVELETYARQFDKPVVKPFMLVIARDVEHAAALERVIKADDFFDGRYKDRAITVHSKKGAEEREEVVQRLLEVEKTGETEIVIHVNMLKEGWDVTNLYTIVPLRAANARTLVEQSIGRGLRLPYGRRTGVKAVDRLTIVAHDRFQEIVDEARRGDSVIQMDVVVIGRDVPDAPQRTVAIPTVVETLLTSAAPGAAGGDGRPAAAPLFATEAERQVARATIEELRRLEGFTSSAVLRNVDVRERVAASVRERLRTDQLGLGDMIYGVDVQRVVNTVTENVVERTIHVPRVVVIPREAVTAGFEDFDLDTGGLRLQPVDDAILIQILQTGQRSRLEATATAVEARPEDYIVRELIDYSDVSYDDQADLLYKLAGQAVTHLRTYLDDAQLDNVLQAHAKRIGEMIHAQMEQHYWQSDSDYVAEVRQGSVTLESINVTAPAGEAARDYRDPVPNAGAIRSMRFTGYAKCVYVEQRYDSVPEKRFAEIVDGDATVMKWVKPGPRTVRIDYATGVPYDPDFIVETTTTKWLCEPKAANEIDDPDVRAKARAAEKWCEYATAHELRNGGKPWRYLLIPDSAITASATLAGLIATYAH
jgi:type III restriction enzyme